MKVPSIACFAKETRDDSGRLPFLVLSREHGCLPSDVKPNMELSLLAQYRMVIGYLGEREQFGWWQSSFFTQGSNAFLSPVFGRTQLLAQCNGVTRAAALVHDERIGIGHVYHLFRLPEELEQGIHQALQEAQLGEVIRKIITSKDSALDYLRKNSTISNQPGVGPTRIGMIESLRDQKAWQTSAGLYLYAFENGRQIFPYFSDIS